MEELLAKTAMSEELYNRICLFYSNTCLSSGVHTTNEQRKEFVNIIVKTFSEGFNLKNGCDCSTCECDCK